jgi:hypothetical protein
MPILADSGRKSTGAAWMKVGDRIKLLSGITGEIVWGWVSLGVPFADICCDEKSGRKIAVWPGCVIEKVNQEE